MDEAAVNKLDKLCKISSSFSSMPESYKKLADFILSSPSALEHLTITQLSKKLSVDPANITRFCQYIGFKGYSELKYSLKYQLITPLKNDPNLFNVQEDTGQILKKLKPFYQQTVGEVMDLLDPKKVESLARKLVIADKIHIYAQGGNISSANYAQFCLWQLGLPCYLFTDPGMTLPSANILSEKDVALGFTLSGDAKIVVEAMRLAKKKLATTAAICGFSDSCLGNLADIVLSYNARIPDNLQYVPLALIGDLTVIGAIQAVLVSRYHDQLKSRLSDIGSITRSNRYSF